MFARCSETVGFKTLMLCDEESSACAVSYDMSSRYGCIVKEFHCLLYSLSIVYLSQNVNIVCLMISP